ncbi:MAG: hypothetical protein QNL62_07890 [Gammaproteobacteria bacterium]|nr:hypothetical protein [Gammaproteobacteria bacterium]
MFMVLGLAAVVQPVLAGVADECRQEAVDYEVVPELSSDYIKDCIDSRGGPDTPSNVESDYEPASESDDAGNPVPESENVEE